MKHLFFILFVFHTFDVVAQDSLRHRNHTLIYKPCIYKQFSPLYQQYEVMLKYTSIEYSYAYKKYTIAANFEYDDWYWIKNAIISDFDYINAPIETKSNNRFSVFKLTATRALIKNKHLSFNLGVGLCYRDGYEFIYRGSIVGIFDEIFFYTKPISSMGTTLTSNITFNLSKHFVFIPEVQLQYYKVAPTFFYTVSTGIGFRFGK
jgi:hypothetical protein